MKTLKTLLIIGLVLTISHVAQAKIWRVNNNLGVTANFTSLIAAHDAVLTLPGDTLMIEGSVTNYVGLRLTKRLIIIGTGYFLTTNPETQAFLIDAKVNGFTFAPGSENSSIYGLSLDQNIVYIGANNCTFSRNVNVSELLIGFDGGCCAKNVSNVTVSQNFSIGTIRTTGNTINSNIIISNNWIGTIAVESNTIALIQNNVFTSSAAIISTNCLYSNNILTTGTINPAANNNTFNNNISSNAAWTPSGTNLGANNQINVAMTDVFTIPLNGLVETSFQLKNPGPGIGTGQVGGDLGIFGGNTPYVLSGMPNVPSIYFYNVPSVGSNTSPLNISIKAKSRN